MILSKDSLALFLGIYLCCLSLTVKASDSAFCYDDSDPDCPGPESWPGACNDGSIKQSPILLPTSPTTSNVPRAINLRMNHYHAGAFSIKNSGHSISVKFPRSPNSNSTPISLGRLEGSEHTQFKLESAHFHWGREDNVGSEHCMENGCFSMEMHLVHYRSDFDGSSSALLSSDPGTLSVVGVMFQVAGEAGSGNPDLAPIISNIAQVASPGGWIEVNQPLDFRPILSRLTSQSNLYTYTGSLTTPDCNEKVNWYVFDRAIPISKSDVAKFRKIYDSRGVDLVENHRPLQSTNDRDVYFASAVSS